MSPSFFDDTNGLPSGGAYEAGDDRTLRLAVHPLTEEELAKLMRYQETFLAVAEASQDPNVLARAHTEGLKVSGLPDAKRVEQGSAVLRTFGGQRWAVSKLKDKLKQLEAQGPEADERRAHIRGELARLEQRTTAFARRYGQETLELLQKHEERLLALHTRMTQLLSRG